ncbi:hypothetical protein [Methylomagnum sp.]
MAGLRLRLEWLEGCFSDKGGFNPHAERELTALVVKRIDGPLTGEEHARMLGLGSGISEPLPPAEQAARLERLRRRWGLSGEVSP